MRIVHKATVGGSESDETYGGESGTQWRSSDKETAHETIVTTTSPSSQSADSQPPTGEEEEAAPKPNPSLRSSIRNHPHAILWSLLLSTTVIMEGFDLAVLHSLLAVPAFQQTFGQTLPNGKHELTAAWQAGLTNGALVGQMLGLLLNGFVADRYGYKKTMLGALLATTAFIFVPFFATSVEQLLTGFVLLGVPWGVFQTLPVTYAADVCPMELRPQLTAWVNLCWVLGQFIASGVLVAVQGRGDEWAYRLPYALQWVWPVPLVVGVAFAPESPWWLARKGRSEEALGSLRRLGSRASGGDERSMQEALRVIQRTNEFEREMSEGISYADCFRGVNLRRTEIVCLVWLVQTASGSTLMGYSTYFYREAGLAARDAFALSLSQYALGIFGTMASWILMSRFGRRALYLSGLATLFTLLLTTGLTSLAPAPTSHWAPASLLLVYVFLYNTTIGPLTYTLVSELPSTRLRQKTVVLARATFNLASIVANVLITRQLNPSAWGWGARAGFFWAGSCVFCGVWAFFRVPEAKGRAFWELDELFAREVGAREFKGARCGDGFPEGGVGLERLGKGARVVGDRRGSGGSLRR